MSEHDAVPPLRLVASSIAGRLLDVRAADDGDRSWTDGRVVYVDRDANPRERLETVAVQASMLAMGSLAPDVVRHLVGRPALTRRYLAIEAPRALAENAERLPPSVSRLAVGRGGEHESANGSLAAALAGRGRPDVPASFGDIRPRSLAGGPGESDVAESAGSDGQHRGAPDTRLDDLEASSDEPDPSLLEMLSDRSGAGGALGRLLQRTFGSRQESGDGPLGSDVPPRGRRVAERPGRGGRRRSPAARNDEREVPPAQRRWVYPEWDARRRKYRSDWCTVTEEDVPHLGTYQSRDSGAMLRRPLSRLGLGLELTHRRRQGDDLDVDAVVEARVDAAAGLQPQEAVYVESLRRRHDLAVLVMLDVSGSAAEPSGAGQSVHDHQMAGATSLVQALHELGNKVALYGFYSKGRSAVRVLPVKQFVDAMDARVLRRLGSLTPGGYTRLGAAIRHGTAVLDELRGTRPLLVVLSDGFAYDHGYDGRYAEADARRALVEARQRGVGCLCLSIGAATDLTALRRVFGSAAHGTVPHATDLRHVVAPMLRDALAAAELQQSVARRLRHSPHGAGVERRSA